MRRSVHPRIIFNPNPQPDSGKALVFVAEDLGRCGECRKGFGIMADVRSAGVKGASSRCELAIALVRPLASPSPSRVLRLRRARSTISARGSFPVDTDFFLDLDLVNTDQGKFLVASSPYSVSHPKN